MSICSLHSNTVMQISVQATSQGKLIVFFFNKRSNTLMSKLYSSCVDVSVCSLLEPVLSFLFHWEWPVISWQDIAYHYTDTLVGSWDVKNRAHFCGILFTGIRRLVWVWVFLVDLLIGYIIPRNLSPWVCIHCVTVRAETDSSTPTSSNLRQEQIKYEPRKVGLALNSCVIDMTCLTDMPCGPRDCCRLCQTNASEMSNPAPGLTQTIMTLH